MLYAVALKVCGQIQGQVTTQKFELFFMGID